jgi:NADH-quinone oxidoreductase subunit A
MNLQEYLPVILFILVGVGVGVAPQSHRFRSSAQPPRQRQEQPLRVRLRGLRGRAHEVRRALLPRGHPASSSSTSRSPSSSRGRWRCSDIGAAGFWAMMVFLGILVVGFVYEWKKGALDWE